MNLESFRFTPNQYPTPTQTTTTVSTNERLESFRFLSDTQQSLIQTLYTNKQSVVSDISKIDQKQIETKQETIHEKDFDENDDQNIQDLNLGDDQDTPRDINYVIDSFESKHLKHSKDSTHTTDPQLSQISQITQITKNDPVQPIPKFKIESKLELKPKVRIAETTVQKHLRSSLSKSKTLKIAAHQSYRCNGYPQQKDCDRPQRILDWTFAIDHKIPLRDGGSNNFSNLQALCHSCHARKSATENILFAEKLAERKTRHSRFWDPICLSYIPPVSKPRSILSAI